MAEGSTTTNGAAQPAAGGNAGQAAVSQLRGARAQLAAKSSELEALRTEFEGIRARAETADTLGARVKALEAELKGRDEQHQTERALFAAGLTDPDELELVKFAHGRLPEKDRPPLGAWVDGLKKDPTKAPKLIEGIAGRWAKAGNAGAAGGGAGNATRTRTRIQPNRGAAAPEVDGGTEPTDQEWAEARRAALRGDRKPLDALKARAGLPVRGPRR